ncbi:DUF6215 domain-containing protein [Actinacidiphila paucisporea]|uniref:Uncharacterized protein n=1 Tax=Actinacidiphila paucisporea TaxID=310782 RepID=A0A1M7N0F0_9ACTN|nr:DUF6215 domain-containing protein [Actinacidiphila paucisporea]SHM96436.1 hypothetical protein SAMN05216499_11756 [Actinacidiphila paucisporea]
MADGVGTPEKGAGTWGQVITAVVLVGGLGVGLWTVERANTSAAKDSAPPAAVCSTAEPDQTASAEVSRARLCELLNRRDLAALLGTPGEVAKSTGTSGGGGSKLFGPSAQVVFDTYAVSLTATYNRLPVADAATLLGGTARRRTVLGRPAISYADRTISVDLTIGGGGTGGGNLPGHQAFMLSVARDAKDTGGSFDVAVWRMDGGVPQDDVLLHVAEAVLPTVPGWNPGV